MAYNNYGIAPQSMPAMSQNNGQQAQSAPILQPQQNIQPLFPQPQGNVYNINSTLEVANVPVGAGVSVALCLPENVMYIKTMQNGNPLFYPYKILPLNGEQIKEEKQEVVAPPPQISVDELVEQIKACNSKITDLERELHQSLQSQKKGSDWDI